MYDDELALFYRRRSIRSFVQKPVEPEKIDGLLRAAMAAPSACNTQPWEIVVTQDSETLSEIREAMIAARYPAPCAITVCGNTHLCRGTKQMWVQDCSAAMQNILLAATALDLDSLWVGVYCKDANDPGVRALSRVLNLPAHIVPLGIAYIGYANEEKPPRTQYNPERIYAEKFDPERKHRARAKNMKHL